MQPRYIRSCTFNLLAAAATLLVVSCGDSNPDSAWWDGENQRISLEQELELKTFRFEQVQNKDYMELQALNKAKGKNQAALEALRLQKKELDQSVASLEGGWDEFRRTVIGGQRQKAMGSKFDEITSASGRTYESVSVSSIDDGGVTIRHKDGSAKLRFADLSAQQRQFFGLEMDLADAALEQEKQHAADYERWIDQRMVTVRAEQRQLAAANHREKLADQRERMAIAAAAVRNASSSADDNRSLAQTSRSWRYSSSRRYRTNYRTVYYCPPRVYQRTYARPTRPCDPPTGAVFK